MKKLTPIAICKSIVNPNNLFKSRYSTLWIRRVTAEYRCIVEEKTLEKEGIDISLNEASELSKWNVSMKCTNEESSAYGKIFQLEVQFYSTYPMRPPLVRFLTPLSPNSNFDDVFLIDALQKCCWNPVVSVEKILLEIQSLL